MDDWQLIALKMLILDAGGSPTAAQSQQFESEINIMRACCHRNIVRFLGGWLEPVRHVLMWVVTEHLGVLNLPYLESRS